jgi:hypothetical protein
MPVHAGNYDHRGDLNYGIVVRCPNVVGDRLVYFDYNRRTNAWRIRDFIVGLILSNSTSPLSVAQIEADADHDEFPPWWNADRDPMSWGTYLRLRTTAVCHLRGAPPTASPNPASGTWQPI